MLPDCVMNSTKLMKHKVFMEILLGQGQQRGWGGERVTRSPGVIQDSRCMQRLGRMHYMGATLFDETHIEHVPQTLRTS